MSQDTNKLRVFKYCLQVPVTVTWNSCKYDDEKTAKWLSEVFKTIVKSIDHHVVIGKIRVLGKGGYIYGNTEQVNKGDENIDA